MHFSCLRIVRGCTRNSRHSRNGIPMRNFFAANIKLSTYPFEFIRGVMHISGEVPCFILYGDAWGHLQMKPAGGGENALRCIFNEVDPDSSNCIYIYIYITSRIAVKLKFPEWRIVLISIAHALKIAAARAMNINNIFKGRYASKIMLICMTF